MLTFTGDELCTIIAHGVAAAGLVKPKAGEKLGVTVGTRTIITEGEPDRSEVFAEIEVLPPNTP